MTITSPRAAAAFASILVFAALLSCGRDRESARADEIQMAVSIFPVCDIARSVAGSRASVFHAVPPGANPHTFEPVPSVVKRLQESRVFLGVHPEFDGWMEKYLKKDTNVSYLLERNHHENPHIWLSIKGGRDIARHIADRLSTVDPEGAHYYRNNLVSFEKTLDELDRRIAGMLRLLAYRKFIQWHPSWDYFAAEYGLEIVDTIEKGHGHEPSVRDFNRLVRRARTEGVRVIVIDLKVQSGAAAALARESGAALLQLDAIGDEDDPVANGYVRLMEHNARLFANALSEARGNK
ncbi:MAG: zinc ABC transporter substrate-binding protein [Spirochaetes bacterium]|jgi:zinc transport system substrate-binding protein|nr:zinc ABC transporter substrate-binding protein [Spirochaetota bacterium]